MGGAVRRLGRGRIGGGKFLERRELVAARRLLGRHGGGCRRALPFIGRATPNCGREPPPLIPLRLPNALIASLDPIDPRRKSGW